MDTEALVDESIDTGVNRVGPAEIAAGDRLVRQLLDDRLPISAAFWFREADGDDWRLLIASQRVEEVGPRTVYRQVQEAIQNLELANLSLGSVVVLTQREPLVQALRTLFPKRHGRVARRLHDRVAHLHNDTVKGVRIPEAYVYLVE